ncbi:MAG: thioredoxin domain-containing protein [Opitutales bacterium]
MPNRLAKERSLYLRQHADNPVDWHPWGPEAFALARSTDRPLLVSVGYSSCHWCHVMARESFAQAWIADLMNRHFVCVKVDREELPEVDKLMMDAVQMVQGQGGWPLNCFCLPDGRPFFGGTYFPPEDRGGGLVPWPQLLMRVSDFYHRSKSELESNADAIAKNLVHLTRAPDADGTAPGRVQLLAAARDICSRHDDEHGGFGGAPKFPSPPTLGLLLAVRNTAAAAEERALGTRLDSALSMTLGAMARGGLYDQVGGGFHRYCIDRTWTVPHFEKMLYDNAQLLGVYAEAWARYRDPLHAAVCEETVGWLRREMALPDGLFASSLDADTDHHEGTTYVWTPTQLQEALGDEAEAFARAYGVTEKGNFEGASVLRLTPLPGLRDRLSKARSVLLAARGRRAQPARDDGPLVGWNALLASGLAKAAWIFGRQDWHTQAAGVAAAAHRALRARPGAPLTDHVWVAESLLAVASCAAWAGGPDADALRSDAVDVMHEARERFRDGHEKGWFLTEAAREDLAVRQKDWFDNATPAANSSLAHVLSALSVLEPEGGWREEFEEHAGAYGGACRNLPSGVAHALEAIVREATGIAIVKAAPGSDWEAFRQALLGDAATRPHALPWRPVHLVTDAANQGWQVCAGRTCLPPESSAERAAALL